MPITIKSRKAKGRSFQREVARWIREFFGLSDSDIRSTAASVGGEDLLFSDFARIKFPFSVECKKQEKLNIWKAIEQAKKNAGKHIPIIVFARNHSETYVTIDLDSFLVLTKYGTSALYPLDNLPDESSIIMLDVNDTSVGQGDSVLQNGHS